MNRQSLTKEKMREPFADAVINIILSVFLSVSPSLTLTTVWYHCFLLFREVRLLLVIFVGVEGTV